MSTENNQQDNGPVPRGARGPQEHRERLTAQERADLRNAVATAYEEGASIRDLVAVHPASYGLIRALLLEAGVTLRTKGGIRAVAKGNGR
ncbi:helix-turn-helix domain-containing protein [Streptomyces microflavus]|uniref:helix-turn-helix domain-containing protein n=1 Tax=Streptomyces microflavus TaxID=1919 RepID=UPI0036591005